MLASMETLLIGVGLIAIGLSSRSMGLPIVGFVVALVGIVRVLSP